MVRPKAPRKKQQQRGVDFKKIKRKIGRKLPPPKNATNTEIKSKESVASEKAGLAVSKKGLTLKELLQQTSHHNSKVRKEKSCPMLENDEISNCGISKSITRAVCSCLLQMGDYCLLFQILEKVVLDQITLNPALDNLCALLRMLVALDARPTRFSQQSIIILSNFLPGYLIDVVSAICFPEDDDESRIPVLRSTRHYYFLPCYILFYRSNKLLNLVLRKMGSLVTEKSRITAIVSVVLLMHKDVKVWKILSSCKTDTDFILQSILVVQVFLLCQFPPSAKFHSLAKAVVPEHVQNIDFPKEPSEEDNMVLEERHKIQSAVDRLNTLISES
ncbi:unnamed protein product [Camellia sinensis]